MFVRQDIHIHTKYLGCANETMVVADVIRACEELGVDCIGFTDHLNSPDQVALHKPILADIRQVEATVPVYFGVELNFTGCDEGFVFSPEIKGEIGFQYAIGGIHQPYVDEFDLDKIIEIQHRHHLATCRNDLVEVLVHPWWFGRGQFPDEGLPDMSITRQVPEKFTRELARTAVQTGTAIEINAGANLGGKSDDYVQAYFEYVSILAAEGVTFALASDAHDIGDMGRVAMAWEMFARLELPPDRLWRPPGEPIIGPAR